MTKINYLNVITDYFSTKEFSLFKEQYLKHIDSSRTYSRISGIKLKTILSVFDYVYEFLNSSNLDHYKHKSITLNNIVKELKLQSQVVTFVIYFLIEFKIISKFNSRISGDKRLSAKYKLLSITPIENEFVKITFKNEINDFLTKAYNKLRKQKSRATDIDLVNKLEKKLNKLKNHREIFNIINNDGGILREKYNQKQITNGRLSHYFVTINKEYRDFILLNENETDNVDFSNSQPTFLANHLLTLEEYKNENDVLLFLNQCIKGNIYEYIANKLSITRNEAKDLWMKVAYGKPYIQQLSFDEATIINKKAEDFYKLFPSVVKFSDDMKNKDLSNTAIFSNFLCELESSIVNPLSQYLKDNGFNNETVYDEFIFELKYKEAVIELIQKYLKQNNLQITLK